MKTVRVLLVVAGFVAALFASESGDLAFRGRQYFVQGRYGDAYMLFAQALNASRKEADLAAEGRIHVALAELSLHAREFTDATRQLDQARLDELDLAGRVGLLQIRLELLNAQGRYAEALAFWDKRDAALTSDDVSPFLVARLYCEAAVATAGAGQGSLADQLLGQAEDLYDDEAPGQLVLARARVADLRGDEGALDLYRSALSYAVSGGRYYVAGSVLLRLGQLSEKQKKGMAAIDYYERSAGVFEQLGLVRPFRTTAERLVELQGDSSPYAAKLKALAPDTAE